MNRIRLLPEQVANQIAAGEVVERPASVVKELVENAIDAQSTRITVEIQAGGRSLIRVTDDGIGMSRDDALLCLERHATSKIQRAEDLTHVSTLGFRGEALPSIASVSRFTLTTRERQDTAPEGTQVAVNGGKIAEVRTAGHAPGTTIEVRQLFFNLPARRKFLRTEETERTHIQHYLHLAALAHPDVGFTFIQDQRLVWQLPPLPCDGFPASRLRTLQERLRALPGAEPALLPVDYSARLDAPADSEAELLHDAPPAPDAGSFRVWGFIGAPGVSRATRQDQHVFVNRRPVDNRAVNFALLEGYHTALMKGRYPACCLFVEIDPAEVDVNIHPAKREVKFRNEFAVRKHVAAAVRYSLLAFHSPPATSPQPAVPPAPIPPPPRPTASALTPSPPLPVVTSQPDLAWTPPAPPPQTSPTRPAAALGPAPPAPAPPPATSTPTGTAVALLQVPLRLIGVVGRLYVLLESDRGLVLMDQHAAHERILYEQMLRRLEIGNAPSQRLLLPETVEVPPRDAQFLREHLEVLGRLGVGLSEFGERTFLLDALPPFVKVADARRFVLELVDELVAAGREVNSLRLGEQTVAKTVCRHAVKANDPLRFEELEKLVVDLRACAMPYTCPHGRPTLIEMNYRELERKFGRTA